MKKSERKQKKDSADTPIYILDSTADGGLDKLLPRQDFKKMVVYIFGKDNIEYVSTLSHEERNTLINNIIEMSREKSFYKMKQETIRKFALQVLVIALTIVVALPLLYVVSNNVFSYTKQATRANYTEYGKPFEKLIEKKNTSINRPYKK